MIIYSLLVRKCAGTQGKDFVLLLTIKESNLWRICQAPKGTEFDLQWDKNPDNDQTS